MMNAARRVVAVARIELARLARSRIALTMLILVPAMQVLLFGYAIRPSGAPLTVAVAAQARVDAHVLTRALARRGGVKLLGDVRKSGDAEAAVRQGKALVGVELYEQPSLANPTAPPRAIHILIDASNSQLVAAAESTIESAYWQALAMRNDIADSGPGYRIERLYDPEARPDRTFLTALIGVTVMIAMIMLGTISLAREREGGTWEALLALPIAPAEALAGKLLPYVVIGTGQGLMVLGAGVWLFDLPVRGAVGALIVLLPIFAAAHLVLGYAISARAPTQMAALQGAVAFYLPAMLLSGFLYPFETLPVWAQTIGNLFPLTHFIRAARGALLKGEGAAMVLTHGAPIMVFLLVALGVAVAAQARRLD